MGEHDEIFSRLAAKFNKPEAKTRTGTGGQVFHYVTARTVMNRLDDVLGPENWWDSYEDKGNHVVCRLTVRLPGGRELTKADAGGHAGMADQGDDDKSAYSDSFKRAAVKFGVGRHLYGDGVPVFVREHSTSTPPGRPAPAPATAQTPRQSTPEPPRPEPTTTPSPQPPSRQGSPSDFRLPPPGKAVFAWAKRMEQHYQWDGIVPLMRKMGVTWGFGGDFLAWSPEHAAKVCLHAASRLAKLDNYKGEFNGLVDLSTTDWENTDYGLKHLDALRGEIKTRVGLLCERVYDKRGDKAVRDWLDYASAAARQTDGTTGPVMEDIDRCADLVWLENILVLASQELKRNNVGA